MIHSILHNSFLHNYSSPQEEIEHYFSEINDACTKITGYLKENERIEDLPESLSELIHEVFYKLTSEIQKCIDRERQELLPLTLTTASKNLEELSDAIEHFAEDHVLILKIVQRLRLILFNYKIEPGWRHEFKECIRQVFRLENNIHKWINAIEELILPALAEGKVKHMEEVYA